MTREAMGEQEPAFQLAYVDAQQRITAILKDFELTTGCVVDTISLNRIDVTRFSSRSREYMKAVEIHVLPKPGDWAIAAKPQK